MGRPVVRFSDRRPRGVIRAFVRVIVVGSALTGTATAIALARRGHDVILLERDPHPAPREAALAFDTWERPGVAHFRLPHSFRALGRQILARHFPDVLDDLRGAGATEMDLTRGAPPGVEPHADLYSLPCRRPVVEWALRRARARETRIRIFDGVRVEGLVADGRPPRIVGVRTHDGASVEADLVVDATGRNSHLARWLAEVGAAAPAEEVSPCGMVHYCRYYRFLDGGTLPQTMHPLGPRADLGHMAFGAFGGDSGTWAITLYSPAWSHEFRALRDEATFERVVSTIPSIAVLADRGVSTPITTVLPMGELRNVRRSVIAEGRPVALGIVATGDVLANTNPAFAWGLSLGIANAVELATAADAHGADVEALALAFEAAAGPRATACYRWSRDTDIARKRLWSGEPVDATSPDGDLPLFLASTLVAAGRRDAEVYLRWLRRDQLLDPLDDLPGDRALLGRAAAIMTAARPASPPPRLGPSRDEVLAILSEAAARTSQEHRTAASLPE